PTYIHHGIHSDIAEILHVSLNETATTEIHTLSLHDALPISCARSATSVVSAGVNRAKWKASELPNVGPGAPLGRRSTARGTRKGTSGSPRRSQSSAMARPTRARRQQISREARRPSIPGSRSTKLSCRKRARPGEGRPVPGETGGTGASV